MPPQRSAASSALAKIKQSYAQPQLCDEVESSPCKTRKTKAPKPKPTKKPRKVIGFLDLPETIRLKIYRLHLVSEAMIEGRGSTTDLPPLLRLSGIADEAALVYCAENHFYFSNFLNMGVFLYDFPTKYARMIRRVTFEWSSTDATWALSKLRRVTQLTELNIRIDEHGLIRDYVHNERGFRNTSGPITPQFNLRILLVKGMDALRKLDNVKIVRFEAPSISFRSAKDAGPIPGGVLTKMVGPEMMGSGSVRGFKQYDDSFPFLKLPPELRNRIYQQVLAVEGPLNPSTRAPTSARISGRGSRSGTRNDRPFPHSVLSLVEVNRQIYEEAVGLFYHINHLEFYYPVQFVTFLNAMSEKRRNSIRKITFWYRNTNEGGYNTADAAYSMLGSLPSLRQLQINCERIRGAVEDWPGFQSLTKLRGSVRIIIRDYQLKRELKLLKSNRSELFTPTELVTQKRDCQLKEFVKKLNAIVNGTAEKPTAEVLSDS